MARMTPEEAARRLRNWHESYLPGALYDIGQFAGPQIAARSVGTFMRDAGASGEVAQATRLRFTKDGKIRKGGKRYTRKDRRSASDSGPLRIVTGKLARAVRSPGPQNGGLNKVVLSGLVLNIQKGVRGGVVPYGAVHEYGFSGSRVRDGATINIPARPYLRPAAEDARPAIAERARLLVVRSLRQAMRQATSGELPVPG